MALCFMNNLERIIVDGVSTKYGLGILGGETKLSFMTSLKLHAWPWFNNNQGVSFSGANFEGPVWAVAEFRIERDIGQVQDIKFG